MVMQPALLDSFVPEGVDLALGAREDHRAVAAVFDVNVFLILFSRSAPPKRKPKCCVNKLALQDPARCGLFDRAMWKY